MKAVFVDLDETLFDHQHACRMGIQWLWDTYEELRQKTVEQLELEFWEMLERMYHDVLAGKISAEQSRTERVRRLLAGCGCHLPEDELQASTARYQREYAVNRRAMADAHELLTAAKERGLSVVVLTNGLTQTQQDKLAACGLTSHIDHLITSHDAGVKKPDARIFKLALERLNIGPEDAVMIGDSWDADIVGAHGVGLKAFWLNRGRMSCPDPELATEIRSLAEAAQMLGWN